MRDSARKVLEGIREEFKLSAADMNKMIRDFRREMDRGLRGRKSSLKMLPSYVTKPTGNEKGAFLAIDLGGTNLRVAEVELKGAGKEIAYRSKSFILKDKLISGSSGKFFDAIAEHLRRFIGRRDIGAGIPMKLGFTFSFPVRQDSLRSGRLICWTKGFSVKGVKGKDVVKLLEEALKRKGLGGIRVSALMNDTVGTLAARSYSDSSCEVGVVIGTGTNACYYDKRLGTIINIEWGNFNRMKRALYDRLLDENSGNPGEQLLEKSVSGMYLGEIVRLIICDLASRGYLFRRFSSTALIKKNVLKAEDISRMEEPGEKGLANADKVLRRYGMMNSTIGERSLVRQLCRIVSRRAARISSAGIIAVLKKIDPVFSRSHTVAIDGSVFEKHPNFAKEMRSGIKDVLGVRSEKVKIVLSKNGSALGAGVAAAISQSHSL